jgi:outer membrane protein, heavy metal efflux system
MISHKILLSLCSIIVALLLPGCSTYQPAPLTRESVNTTLTPKTLDVLQVQAKTIKHPILRPIKVTSRFSPDSAAVVAVLSNPSLRAVRDERGIAQAQLLSAGILPNPQLSAELDIPVNNNEQTFNGYNVGITWEITALIARQAKIDSAKAVLSSVDLDIAWQEWQIAQAARIAVFKQLSLEQELAVAILMKRRLDENLALIKNAVEQQLKTDIDLTAAQAASDEAKTTVLELSRDLEKQKLSLARVLGFPADTNIPLQEEIVFPSRFNLPSQGELLNNLEQKRLDLLALKLGYESREQAVRAAVLSSFPKINLGINKARDTSDIKSIGPNMAIDLPIFDRNQGGIAAEKATRQKLFDEYSNRVFEARSDIAVLLADIDELTKQIESIQLSLPGIERLADAYKTAYETGSADILSFYAAQNDAAKKTIELLKSKQELIEMYIGLEIAAGQYIQQPVL